MGKLFIADFRKKQLYSVYDFDKNKDDKSKLDANKDVKKMEYLSQISEMHKPKWIKTVDIGHVIYSDTTNCKYLVTNYNRDKSLFEAIRFVDYNNKSPNPAIFELYWHREYQIVDFVQEIKELGYTHSFEYYEKNLLNTLK